MNILVTGAGSLIGHGILRSIRKLKRTDITVVTADPDYRAVGHWLGDHGVLIPMAKDPHYVEALKKLIADYNIDVVFIGTDPELLTISESKKELSSTVVVSDPAVIKIGDDKWDTVQFLRENGFPYPDSALAVDESAMQQLISRVGFPLIAKPRIGARSVGVTVLKNEADIHALKNPMGYVCQELLPESEGEFTAGTMTYEKESYSCVIFRRDLKEGNTYRAYHVENKVHEEFLHKVSAALPGVYGPINFQYRIKNGQPIIFEINSRFSGTTPLRAAVGVNEIEMAIEYITHGTVNHRAPTLKNVSIFRTWSDIIVPNDQLNGFKEQSHLDGPDAKYFPFMN